MRTEDYIEILQGEPVHIIGDLGVLYDYGNKYPVSWENRLKYCLKFSALDTINMQYHPCKVVISLLKLGLVTVEIVDYAPVGIWKVIQNHLSPLMGIDNFNTMVTYEQLDYSLWNIKDALDTELSNRINRQLLQGGLVIDGRNRDWWEHFILLD